MLVFYKGGNNMAMKREALVLYIENIRDLEVAKEQANKGWLNTKKDRDMILGGLSRNIERMAPPVKEDYVKINIGSSLIILLVSGILLIGVVFFGAVISRKLIIESNFGDPGINSFKEFMNIGGVLIIGMCVVLFIWAIQKRDESEQKYLAAVTEYEKYNEAAEKQEKTNRYKYETVYKAYKDKMDFYQSENKRIGNILNEFYSMNVIPIQFRDLKQMIYIYDYLTTTEATLETALFETQIEDGIKRIEDKLDIILEGIEKHIMETRCMNVKNHEAVQRQINSNALMLSDLKRAEQNAADAAAYEKLMVNYSLANTYFGFSYPKLIESIG